MFLKTLEMDVLRNKNLILKNLNPFSPERKTIEKVKKLVCSTEDKENYVVHRKALKQTLNHGLIF